MGLLRRGPKIEEEPERCPVCNERIPDDEAAECAMCGADLRALRPRSRRSGMALVAEDPYGTTSPRRIA